MRHAAVVATLLQTLIRLRRSQDVQGALPASLRATTAFVEQDQGGVTRQGARGFVTAEQGHVAFGYHGEDGRGVAAQRVGEGEGGEVTRARARQQGHGGMHT